MKNIKIIILLTYLFLFSNFVYALEGSVEYDGVYIDYSSFNYNEWKTKAEEYLDVAKKAKDKNQQKKYYAMSAGAYQTLIKIYPADPEVMATLGHIYGKMHKPEHAKAFLDRGLNLGLKNPLVNYYYGLFYQDEKDYRNALKFYNYAYEYGMENNADLNLRLGVVNAKLGELNNSKFHYQRAKDLLKNTKDKNKIH